MLKSMDQMILGLHGLNPAWVPLKMPQAPPFTAPALVGLCLVGSTASMTSSHSPPHTGHALVAPRELSRAGDGDLLGALADVVRDDLV